MSRMLSGSTRLQSLERASAEEDEKYRSAAAGVNTAVKRD